MSEWGKALVKETAFLLRVLLFAFAVATLLGA